MDLQLVGKRALVTGSSAGIGLAVARQLLAEGARVALCGRRADRLESARRELVEGTGGDVVTLQADVTVPADVDALARGIADRLGGLDILVNNAGTGIYKPFLEVTDEELVSAMQMNFLAMFRVTQRLLPLMLDAGGGAIVNVTGTSGSSVLDAPFHSTCSGPAKAAENRFTKALAIEFGPRNIRVNSVAPGRVNAPERFERWCADIAKRSGQTARTPDELKRSWGQRIALGDHRWAEIDEIARLVVFAASPACGFMTGALLVADGGETRD
jgi:3-oxoacyl-[acyl-carrier protein] reductase